MLRHLDSSARQAMRALRLRPLAIHSSRISTPLHGTTQKSLALSCTMLYSSTPQPQPLQGHSSPAADTSSHSSEAEFATAKPFDAIPTPKRIPLIGMSRDFMKFSPSQAVRFVQERVENLGKIFREKMVPGLPEFLFVLDPEDVAKVFRADGRHPRRFPISEWTDVRKELNIPTGLFLS